MDDITEPRKSLRLVDGPVRALPRVTPIGEESHDRDNQPLALPKFATAGVYTAPWCLTEDVPLLVGVSSKGVALAWFEVRTVGEARDARERLEALIDADAAPSLALIDESDSP